MEYIDKYVLIKEAPGGRQDRIFAVKGLQKNLIYERDGALLSGIEMSQTGDGAFVFFNEEREAEDRLKTIDRYIERTLPRDVKLPSRKIYASVPGDSRSGPVSYDQILTVDLPMEKEEEVKSAPTISGKEMFVHTPKEVKPSKDLFCVECDYSTPKKRALNMHVYKAHGRKLKDGPPNNT